MNRIKEDQLFKNKEIKTRLLYKAQKDGDDQKIFHEKCDGIANTLVIVHTMENLKFGGFTTAKWNNKDIEEKDDHAFCFNLNNKKIFLLLLKFNFFFLLIKDAAHQAFHIENRS